MLIQKRLLVVSSSDQYEQQLTELVSRHILNPVIYRCRIDIQLPSADSARFVTQKLSYQSKKLFQEAEQFHFQAEELHGTCTAMCCDDLIDIIENEKISMVAFPFVPSSPQVQNYYTTIIEYLQRSTEIDILAFAL